MGEASEGISRQQFFTRSGLAGLAAAAGGAGLMSGTASAQSAGDPAQAIGDALLSGRWEVVDLSLATGENYPVNFPGDPQFNIVPITAIKGRRGINGTNGAVEEAPYAVQRYEITEHTGTQIDFPPHFIPPPGVNIPGARGNAFGRKTGDEYTLDSLMGPAVVIDGRALLAANKRKGRSAVISADWLRRWEERYGRLSAGDVPVLFSAYTDRFYRRFPKNNRMMDRLLWKVLVDKSEPGWLVAAPDAVELMNDRGVKHIATDAPSFGAAENPQPSHVAGLKYGMTWTEGATRLGSLPLRGAFYVAAPYKVIDQQAAIARAFALKARGATAVGSGAPLEL